MLNVGPAIFLSPDNVTFSLFVASDPSTLQHLQGDGDCYIISEHSWQHLYSSVWGYCGSRFTSSVTCFLETGLVSFIHNSFFFLFFCICNDFVWINCASVCVVRHDICFLLAIQVVGLDLVDDESKPERRPTKHMRTPDQWTNVFNPAFSYYVYYCYANLYTLNKVYSWIWFYLY